MMNKLLCVLLTGLYFFQQNALMAQDNDANAAGVILLNINYAAELPAGDLKNRFGYNSELSAGLDWMFKGSNFFVGVDGGILFGNRVKEDVIASLRTAEGFVIGNDRVFADLQLKERGIFFGGHVGNLFPFNPAVNKRAGLRVTVGVGLLQHKIRIQDDAERGVAPLTKVYKKGYDRLTNGLSLNQFVGYQMMSNNRRVNFYLGLEATQAFTQSRRNFNFDTQTVDIAKRIDILYGIKAGFSLPFYLISDPDKVYY